MGRPTSFLLRYASGLADCARQAALPFVQREAALSPVQREAALPPVQRKAVAGVFSSASEGSQASPLASLCTVRQDLGQAGFTEELASHLHTLAKPNLSNAARPSRIRTAGPTGHATISMDIAKQKPWGSHGAPKVGTQFTWTVPCSSS
jgi:hypothetical protein